MEIHDLLAAIGVVAGLVGIVVVLLPGLVLQVVAVAFWAWAESSTLAWVIVAIVIGIAITATILKYGFPGRRLREAGIPGWVLLVAVLVAVVGLFAIPLAGAPLGFVLTVYVFEWARKGRARAWPSTKTALKAVFASIGIELAGGFLIAVVFLAAVLLT